MVGDRGFALAAAAAIVSCLASTRATALPPVELSDIAAGTGGFVINGIDGSDASGFSVSGAGDVNGDRLADLIVAAPNAGPGGNHDAGESYVVFGPPPCPGDCDSDGQVATADLLALLINWGGTGPCDFDGNGAVDTADLLVLLAHWGPCP